MADKPNFVLVPDPEPEEPPQPPATLLERIRALTDAAASLVPFGAARPEARRCDGAAGDQADRSARRRRLERTARCGGIPGPGAPHWRVRSAVRCERARPAAGVAGCGCGLCRGRPGIAGGEERR